MVNIFDTLHAGNMDSFSRMVREAKLVSVDVFDTLLLRDSLTPDAVQRFAGQRLDEMHPETAAEFFRRRKAAEHAARAEKAFCGDVGLSEIYSKFERTKVWTEEVIALARRLEEETDARTLQKRPGIERMLRLAKDEGKRLIVLSDTYYSTSHVTDLLNREGLAHFFDEIYVSSDQNARKDRGDLWDKVLRRERVLPCHWLHVGDNEQSDIQAASDRKLNSLHIMRPSTLLECADLDLSSPEPCWATDLIMGPVANRLAANMTATGASGRLLIVKDAEEFGFCVFGPIVFSFLHWIVNHPARKTVSSLYFLSREGYLLHRIYRELVERYPTLGLPPGTYLYASRRATLSASQGVEFAPGRVLSEEKFEGTMAELLRQRIGLELTKGSIFADWPVRLPNDKQKVLNVLQALKTQIVAHAADALEPYRRYLEQVGLMGDPASAVVDIGYSATIQAGLQIIAGRPMTGFYFGTSPRARQVEDRGGRAFGYLAQEVAPGSSPEPVIACSLLMEAFLIAPHGQLIAFQVVGDAVTPIFREPSHDRHSAAVLTAMHEGAWRYCSKLMDVYGEAIWRSVIDKRAPQQLFRALVEGRVDIPDELRTILHVEDDFCGIEFWKPLEAPIAPWKTC